VLDVLLFDRLKSAKKSLPRDDSQDPQADHAMRVSRASEITTTSSTVRGSREKIGFGFVKRDGIYDRLVNKGPIPILWRHGKLIAQKRGCRSQGESKGGDGLTELCSARCSRA
jgi:hypothetical protein